MSYTSLLKLLDPQDASPDNEPLTLAEIKTHCRVDDTDDDDYLFGLIIAARRYAEEYTRRAFIRQTWRMKLQTFDNVIEIPKPPLLSIDSFTYLDTNGNDQAVAASIYYVDTDSIPGAIRLSYGQAWPEHRRQQDAITITYQAGYGDVPSDVPAELRHGVKLLVAHWYEQREESVIGSGLNVHHIPLGLKSLLGMHRLESFL